MFCKKEKFQQNLKWNSDFGYLLFFRGNFFENIIVFYTIDFSKYKQYIIYNFYLRKMDQTIINYEFWVAICPILFLHEAEKFELNSRWILCFTILTFYNCVIQNVVHFYFKKVFIIFKPWINAKTWLFDVQNK